MGSSDDDSLPVTGVLITGVFGSGKSTVAAELAYLLEERGEPYALLDLDYLSWAGIPSSGRAAELRLLAANLAAVAANYRAAGVRRFVLAWTARDDDEVAGVRAALGAPLRVATLTVPLEVIERRLAADVTSGRPGDLEVARQHLAAGTGPGTADISISNDGPVTEIARSLLSFLGW